MDVRFRGKSGHAADISATTELAPVPSNAPSRRPLRAKRSSNQIELLYSVCGAIAVVDASNVSNFAQTPDGQRRNRNINRYAIAKRSVFISTC
jgi:hypothetical protein